MTKKQISEGAVEDRESGKTVHLVIPKWEKIQRRIDEADALGADLELPPLEAFIHGQEPAGSGEKEFREQLAKAVEACCNTAFAAAGSPHTVKVELEK